jgi:hypothetical protein
LTKRSAQSSPSSQLDPIFFIDRSLGSTVVFEALCRAKWKVERHDDHFSPTTEDTVWIRFAGVQGWIILSADQRIRYNPEERRALIESGTLAFLLAGGNNQTGEEMAAGFLKAEAKNWSGAALRAAVKRERPEGGVGAESVAGRRPAGSPRSRSSGSR